MPRIDVDVLEDTIIQVIREARQSVSKNAARHVQIGGQYLKIHVIQQEPRTWIVRVVTKQEG